MGSEAHVLVVGPPTLLDEAEKMIVALQHRWSRFEATSEVSVLNDAAGRDVVVSPETLLLVARAIQAWELTDGAYDPTVLDALEAAGYDRDFAQVQHSGARVTGAGVPGVRGIQIDAAASTVRLPADVRIDSGGIGKGLAADLVVERLLLRGAAGVCVNIGGDLRVAGTPPDGGQWRVDITHPISGEVLAQFGMHAGAAATSSPLRRRWWRGGVAVHHLIDPATGRPARSGVAAVTVLASQGWEAEALTKAAVLAGTVPRARALLSAHDRAGVVIDLDGAVFLTRTLERIA